MTNSKKALITIGITCFDAEDTIARAIESAGKQDWSNFEIIVVDDHSTDNSIKITEDIQSKDQESVCAAMRKTEATLQLLIQLLSMPRNTLPFLMMMMTVKRIA